MSEATVSLIAAEARAEDIGRGILRVDPEVMQGLGLRSGDTVEVQGDRTAIARLLPNFPADRGKGEARLDGMTRGNAGIGIGRPITLKPVPCKPAQIHHPAVRGRPQAGGERHRIPGAPGRRRAGAHRRPHRRGAVRRPHGRTGGGARRAHRRGDDPAQHHAADPRAAAGTGGARAGRRRPAPRQARASAATRISAASRPR